MNQNKFATHIKFCNAQVDKWLKTQGLLAYKIYQKALSNCFKNVYCKIRRKHFRSLDLIYCQYILPL